MPTLFFADLVRELAQEGGTGPLTLTGAVPGHRRFAGAVPTETPFYYAVAGIARPDQWEVGVGHIDTAGKLRRDAVSASSAAAERVDFAPGLKTIALTVGADWCAATDASLVTTGVGLATLGADVAALEAVMANTRADLVALDANVTGLEGALADKQPLSTLHASVSNAAPDDLMTVRRGGGWVNLPLTVVPFRDGSGAHQMAGPVAATGGSAGAPSLAFAGDADTGLFRPLADAIGFSTGAAERMRLTPTGLGVGVAAPYCRGELVGPANAAVAAVGADPGAANLGIELWGTVNLLPPAQTRGFVGTGNSGIGTAGDLLIAPRTNAGCAIRFLTGGSGPVERMRISATGSVGIGTAAPQAMLDLRGNMWVRAPDNSYLHLFSTASVGSLSVCGSNDFRVLFNDTTERLRLTAGGTLAAGSDNVQNLGSASQRWAAAFVASGVLSTSDAREKSWRGAATEAELRAARRIVAELGFFQWNEAIVRKGADDARYHFGVRAQAVWAVMASEGLIDPIGADGRPGNTPYAFLCWDEWPESGNGADDTGGAGDRFGLRIDQLALFLIAAQEQRIAALEAAA